MTITALPTAPSTADPTTFATRADALIAALSTFVSEANALAVAMNLNATNDTSASSVAIGTGAKSFTVSTGKSFQPGMFLMIADTAAPSTNSMYGQITSYNSGTGALVVNVTITSGSGTKTAWTISMSSGGGSVATTATNLSGGTVDATTITASSSILSSSPTAGIGYGTGAGGTSACNQNSQNTLNAMSGTFTVNSATYIANTMYTAGMNGAAILETDIPTCSLLSQNSNLIVSSTRASAGGWVVYLWCINGFTGTVGIEFAIVRTVTS